MPNQLLENLRAKYPGSYDDLPDDVLAQKIVAKYPEYGDDLADLLGPRQLQGPPTFQTLAAQRKATGGNVYGGVQRAEPQTSIPPIFDTAMQNPMVRRADAGARALLGGIGAPIDRSSPGVMIGEVLSGRAGLTPDQMADAEAQRQVNPFYSAPLPNMPTTPELAGAAEQSLGAAAAPWTPANALIGGGTEMATGSPMLGNIAEMAAPIAGGVAALRGRGMVQQAGRALTQAIGMPELGAQPGPLDEHTPSPGPLPEGPTPVVPKEERIVGILPSLEVAEGKVAALDAKFPDMEHKVTPVEVEGKPTRYAVTQATRTAPTPEELGVDPVTGPQNDPLAGGPDWTPNRMPPEEVAAMKGEEVTPADRADAVLRAQRESRAVPTVEPRPDLAGRPAIELIDGRILVGGKTATNHGDVLIEHNLDPGDARVSGFINKRGEFYVGNNGDEWGIGHNLDLTPGAAEEAAARPRSPDAGKLITPQEPSPGAAPRPRYTPPPVEPEAPPEGRRAVPRLRPGLALEPRKVDIRGIQQIAKANDGVLAPEQVPEHVALQAVARRHVEQMIDKLHPGAVGRSVDWRTGEWSGTKSPLPKKAQMGYGHAQAKRILELGLAGEKLTPKQAKFFQAVMDDAIRKDGPLQQQDLERLIAEHGLNVRTAEEADAAHVSRVEAEARGAEDGDTSFDFADEPPPPERSMPDMGSEDASRRARELADGEFQRRAQRDVKPRGEGVSASGEDLSRRARESETSAYEGAPAAPQRTWEQAKADYRARRIGDAEFEAARKANDAEQRRFDIERGELSPNAPPPTMDELRAARAGTKETISELSPEASERQRRAEALGEKRAAPSGETISGTQQGLGLSEDYGRKLDQTEMFDRASRMEEEARAGLADLRKNRKGTVLGTLGGGAQDFAEELPYLAKLGAAKILRGAATIEEFAKAFPEYPTEHVQQIWDAAREVVRSSGEAIPGVAREASMHPGPLESDLQKKENAPLADVPVSGGLPGDARSGDRLAGAADLRGEGAAGEPVREVATESRGRAEVPRSGESDTAGVPPETGPGATPRVEIPEELSTKLLHRDAYRKAIDAAGELFLSGKLKRDKSMMISDQITKAIRSNQVPLGDLDAVLEKHGLTHQQFADEIWRANPRAYGQGLQALSQLERQINRMGAAGLDISDESAKLAGLKRQLGAGGSGFWRRLDGLRRGLLVTQVTTSVRNATSQGLTAVLNAIDETVQSGLQKGAKAVGLGKKFKPENTVQPIDGLESLGNLVRGTKETKKLEALLDEFPAHRDKLFGSYSDIDRESKGFASKALDKAEGALDKLNVLNKAQEFVFRRGAFLSKLAQRVEGRGQDFERIFSDPKKFAKEISSEDVHVALDHALEQTFATPPKSAFGRALVQVLSAPGVSLITPFPRFMTNALKYQFAYSPLGFLKLLSKGERQAISAGNMKVLSRATIGTGMLGAAYLARTSDAAGEKWYEFKVGGKTVDIRPFNPFASYFFAADLLKRKKEHTLDKLDSSEILQGIASVNLRAGTGLSVLDHLADGLREVGNTEKLGRLAKQTAGEAVAGLLTPLGTIYDLAAHFDTNLQKSKDVKDEPFLGPIKRKIPLDSVQDSMPDMESPTREATPTRPNPLLRQFAGVTTVEEKNSAEKELDRHQFDRKEILPGSGEPAFDRAVAKNLGPAVEQVVGGLVETDGYKELDFHMQALVLSRLVGRIRRVALKMAKAENPEMFAKIQQDRIPSRLKGVLDEIAREDKATEAEPVPGD